MGIGRDQFEVVVVVVYPLIYKVYMFRAKHNNKQCQFGACLEVIEKCMRATEEVGKAERDSVYKKLLQVKQNWYRSCRQSSAIKCKLCRGGAVWWTHEELLLKSELNVVAQEPSSVLRKYFSRFLGRFPGTMGSFNEHIKNCQSYILF